MATIEQQTFIDRLNSAEGALGELASFADKLATRLVGYAGEDAEGYGDSMPSNGYLSGVGDTASRMIRKVDEIRRCLDRVNKALPSEAVSKGVAIGMGADPRLPGQIVGKW